VAEVHWNGDYDHRARATWAGTLGARLDPNQHGERAVDAAGGSVTKVTARFTARFSSLVPHLHLATRHDFPELHWTIGRKQSRRNESRSYVDDPQTPEPDRRHGEPEESDLQRAFTNARRRSTRITDAVRERVADIRDGKKPTDPPDGDG
jgi:hypothetical protein